MVLLFCHTLESRCPPLPWVPACEAVRKLSGRANSASPRKRAKVRTQEQATEISGFRLSRGDDGYENEDARLRNWIQPPAPGRRKAAFSARRRCGRALANRNSCLRLAPA